MGHHSTIRRITNRPEAQIALVMLMLFQMIWFLAATSRAAAPSALRFNGTNQQVTVANATSLRITTNMTIEAWIKPSSVTHHQHIVGKNNYELSVEPLGSGFKVIFEFSANYGAWTPLITGELALNQWYHVAGTYDGTTMRIFINGVQAGQLAKTGQIDQTSQPLRIASADGSGDFFAGVIDEVRLSNVIRYTGAFTAPSGPFTADANTAGLWHLDEGSGTTTADASGKGNTGTLQAGPTWTTDSPFDGASAATNQASTGQRALAHTHSGGDESTPATPVDPLGNQQVELTVSAATPGTALAMPFVASGDTLVDALHVYLDGSSAASEVVVGLYESTENNQPGDLLTTATIAQPTLDAWNTANVPSARLSAGATYWISVLGPVSSGEVGLRGGGAAFGVYASALNDLMELPEVWTTGSVTGVARLSAYVSGAGNAQPGHVHGIDDPLHSHVQAAVSPEEIPTPAESMTSYALFSIGLAIAAAYGVWLFTHRRRLAVQVIPRRSARQAR